MGPVYPFRMHTWEYIYTLSQRTRRSCYRGQVASCSRIHTVHFTHGEKACIRTHSYKPQENPSAIHCSNGAVGLVKRWVVRVESQVGNFPPNVFSFIGIVRNMRT